MILFECKSLYAVKQGNDYCHTIHHCPYRFQFDLQLVPIIFNIFAEACNLGLFNCTLHMRRRWENMRIRGVRTLPLIRALSVCGLSVRCLSDRDLSVRHLSDRDLWDLRLPVVAFRLVTYRFVAFRLVTYRFAAFRLVTYRFVAYGFAACWSILLSPMTVGYLGCAEVVNFDLDKIGDDPQNRG